MPLHKRVTLGQLLIALILLGILLSLSAWFLLEQNGYFNYQVRSIPFDALVWRATPSDFTHESMRLRMVDDLLASEPIVGLTRTQIEAVLGPPDSTSYFSDFEMVYHLGQQRGFIPIDSEWLVIDLDSRDVATSASIAVD